MDNVGDGSHANIFLLVGTFRTPPEFISEALALTAHPLDTLGEVADDDLRTIFDVLSWGPDELAARRAEELLRWEELLRKLVAAETEVHQKLAPGPAFCCCSAPLARDRLARRGPRVRPRSWHANRWRHS